MHKSLEAVCTALDNLSTAVINSWPGEQTFNEAWGWNCPTLTRHDVALLPKGLAERIREAAIDELDSELLKTISDLPRRLQHLQSTTVPQLFGGNCPQASSAFIGTINGLERTLAPILAWQAMSDNKMMPANLAKRIRILNAEIAQLTPDKEALEGKITLIKDATEAAENLPADLLALKEARDKISGLTESTTILSNKVIEKEAEAKKSLGNISNFQSQADELVKKCEVAYRITTSISLAGAFDKRAKQLEKSMWIWVFGLMAALVIGALLGASRIAELSGTLSEPEPKWGVLWMHIILSVLSIGGPLWFAWLATKQIGQRFRLTEDYAFKASVAQAYEGYRKAATQLDPIFEARLFSSALNRFDEAPLRLVEDISHGSPWHELVNSDAFRKAMDMFPDLKNKFIAEAKRLNEAANGKAKSSPPTGDST